MSSLHMLPEGVDLPADGSASILEAALKAGIPLAHACGGQAQCSTCRIVVLEAGSGCPQRGEAERAIAQRLGFDPMVRLACQTAALPGTVVRRLVLDEEDAELATRPLLDGVGDAVGEEIDAAIVFSDIRGFTRIARRLTAYDTIHALNRYYLKAGEAIAAHGGRIDNYMGDGFLAVFTGEEKEARAVRAALDIAAGVEARGRAYFLEGYGVEFRVGLGIHRGRVVAGQIGHPASRRQTLIGEAVNTAARIEAATKQAGTTVLASAEVREACAAAFAWEEYAGMALAGIDGTHTLHAPSAGDPEGARESMRPAQQ